jgi:YVTN family beta-propeller protein
VTISGNYGYFTVTGIAQLNVLDTTTDTWIATVQPVASDPYDVSANADGTSVWVSGTRGTISVLDTRDPHHPVLTDTIELGASRGPREVAFHPDGTKAYVALFVSNTVGVISIPDLHLITEIPVGTTPQALDIALLDR